jgi:hypothetical protein
VIVHVAAFVVFEWLIILFTHILKTEQTSIWFMVAAKKHFLCAISGCKRLFIFLQASEPILVCGLLNLLAKISVQ